MSTTAQAGEGSRNTLLHQIKGLDNRFWILNVMEMFERFAYYGVRSVIAIYMVLPTELGGPQLTHIQKGTIFAWWAGFQTILPMFIGGYADRYGHKRTIAFSIILDILGYCLMANLKSYAGFFLACSVLATGTAIFKPGLQGSLAATLKKSSASVGWGIFYQLVNIGAFIGPVLTGVLRLMDWKYVFYACAGVASINFFWLPFYDDPSKGFQVTEAMKSPFRVFWTSIRGIFRPRIFFFCIIFSGFWIMFNQVFDLLPNTIDDWVDSSGILAALGAAFSRPLIPFIVACLLALLFGAICAIGVLIAMRPDRKSAQEVNRAAYVVVAISFTAALYLPLRQLMARAAYVSAPMIAALLAYIFYRARVGAKPIAWGVFGLGTLGSLFTMNSYFSAHAQTLVELAKQGRQVNPEWMINLNPALITLTMVFFAYLSSFMRPLQSIILGMTVATLGSIIAGTAMVGIVCILGIFVFSVGEMLSSPKKLEYFASLSPKGQEGLYMGYANIPVAIGWIVGNVFAGSRYEFTGDKVNLARRHLEAALHMSSDAVKAIPKSEVMTTLANKLNVTVLEAQKMLFQLYHPNKVWLEIAAMGFASVIGMIIYDRVIRYYDRKRA